jgi:hypothetical protein
VKRSLEGFGYHTLDFDNVYNALKKTKSITLFKAVALLSTGACATTGLLAADAIATIGLDAYVVAAGAIGGVPVALVLFVGLCYKMIR